MAILPFKRSTPEEPEMTTNHKSDCAIHNMPAELPGPCNCGVDRTPRERAASFLDAIEPLNKAQRIDAVAAVLSEE